MGACSAPKLRDVAEGCDDCRYYAKQENTGRVLRKVSGQVVKACTTHIQAGGQLWERARPGLIADLTLSAQMHDAYIAQYRCAQEHLTCLYAALLVEAAVWSQRLSSLLQTIEAMLRCFALKPASCSGPPPPSLQLWPCLPPGMMPCKHCIHLLLAAA